MSDTFSKGDKVRFQHWVVEDQVLVGTIFDIYRVMGETYLVVKTEDGCTYSPVADRCQLQAD